MPKEIEAKYRLDDPAATRGLLAAIGAEHVGLVLEVNRYFDRPDRSLRGGDRAMRIRLAQPLASAPQAEPAGEPMVTVTFKGPREASTVKVRDELEFVADNADVVAAVLGGLGLQEVFLFEKRRDTWILNECSVTLDEVPALGDFLEIEGPCPEAIGAAAELLGLTEVHVEPGTYMGMLARYMEAEGLSGHSIRF